MTRDIFSLSPLELVELKQKLDEAERQAAEQAERDKQEQTKRQNEAFREKLYAHREKLLYAGDYSPIAETLELKVTLVIRRTHDKEELNLYDKTGKKRLATIADKEFHNGNHALWEALTEGQWDRAKVIVKPEDAKPVCEPVDIDAVLIAANKKQVQAPRKEATQWGELTVHECN